jgi:cell division protein FtsB
MSLVRKWMIAGAALFMVGFLLLIVLGDNGLVELSHLKQRRQDLARRNEALARENVDLYRVIKRLKHDPVYIESVARHELGMVGQNDLVILRPGANERNN